MIERTYNLSPYVRPTYNVSLMDSQAKIICEPYTPQFGADTIQPRHVKPRLYVRLLRNEYYYGLGPRPNIVWDLVLVLLLIFNPSRCVSLLDHIFGFGRPLQLLQENNSSNQKSKLATEELPLLGVITARL